MYKKVIFFYSFIPVYLLAPNINDLLTAIKHDDYLTTQSILELDPQLVREYGLSGGWDIKTPLSEAVKLSHTHILQLLFECNEKLNNRARLTTSSELANFGGYESPLHIAIFAGKLHNVKFLLSHGADPNGVNVEGLTPLHAATFINSTEIIDTLLEAGAKMEICGGLSVSYTTPLALSAMRGQTKVVSHLRNKGASSMVNIGIEGESIEQFVENKSQTADPSEKIKWMKILLLLHQYHPTYKV